MSWRRREWLNLAAEALSCPDTGLLAAMMPGGPLHPTRSAKQQDQEDAMADPSVQMELLGRVVGLAIRHKATRVTPSAPTPSDTTLTPL